MTTSLFQPKPFESLLVLLGKLSLTYLGVDEAHDPILTSLEYGEEQDHATGIDFWVVFKPDENPKIFGESLSEHLKSLIPEVKVQVEVEVLEENISEPQINGHFFIRLSEPESIPELLLNLLNRPHRIVGMNRHGKVLLLTDLDILKCTNKPAFHSYYQSQGWTPNRLSHYFVDQAGRKISPRWVIEYLLETKDLPKYQVFNKIHLRPDIMYNHSRDLIRLMKELHIPLMIEAKRGKSQG